MSENYKPRVGDRVRVVLEGEVTDADFGRIRVGAMRDNPLLSNNFVWFNHGSEGVSIEKIEPPVEVFKPGDVVRSRDSGYHYTLAEGGYVANRSGRFMRYRETVTQPSSFNSKRYEKVNLG